MHDQSAWQAWMIAIPTVLTAAAHWYTNRKTTKTIAKSDEKTSAVVGESRDALDKDLKALTTRIITLERAVATQSQNYLNLSSKYSDSVNQLHRELVEAKQAFQRMAQLNGGGAEKNVETEVAKSPEPEQNGVNTENKKDPNFGKVVWKKE